MEHMCKIAGSNSLQRREGLPMSIFRVMSVTSSYLVDEWSSSSSRCHRPCAPVALCCFIAWAVGGIPSCLCTSVEDLVLLLLAALSSATAHLLHEKQHAPISVRSVRGGIHMDETISYHAWAIRQKAAIILAVEDPCHITIQSSILALQQQSYTASTHVSLVEG